MDGEEQQRAQQLAPAGLSLQVQEAALFSRARFWMGSRQRGKGVTWAGEKEKAKVAQATPSAPTSLPTPKPKEQKKKMESTGQASFNPKSTGQSSFLANSSKEEEKLWRVEQKRPLRILCLHGYTQNGNIFRRKLRALETAVIKQIPGSKFIYPTAPHAANEDWVTFNEETDASVDGFTGESRGWWLHGEDPNGGTAVVSPGSCMRDVDSSLNHALIIQFFKGYRLEGKWVLEHAVFGGVVRHGMSRNFSLGCRIDQQV